MYCAKRMAVVVPAYNEAGRLGAMLREVPAWVDDILVVDDASTDATNAEARTSGDTRVRVRCHERNRGVGAAIATGYAWALECGADLVAVMAADGQMNPDELEALVEPVAQGAVDYAKGNRFARVEVWRRMPPARLAGNLALSVLTRPLTGYWRVFDSQCGYTVISREALRRLPLGALYPRYGVPNDLLSRLAEMHARVADIPVEARYPAHHSHMRLPRVVPPLVGLLGRLACRRVRQLWKESHS